MLQGQSLLITTRIAVSIRVFYHCISASIHQFINASIHQCINPFPKKQSILINKMQMTTASQQEKMIAKEAGERMLLQSCDVKPMWNCTDHLLSWNQLNSQQIMTETFWHLCYLNTTGPDSNINISEISEIMFYSFHKRLQSRWRRR